MGMEPRSSGRTLQGRRGEERVVSILESEGWAILERNFRTRRGEIDIVALRGTLLAFIEVKTWNVTGQVFLSDAISARKRARIIETSKFFLSKYRQYNWNEIRYDVFLLSPDGGERVRYEGAFDETL